MKEKTKQRLSTLIKIVLLFALLVPAVFVFSACSSTAYVTGITAGETVGNTTVYTITYSDGSTSTITVENGSDGSDLDIESIFAECVAQGLYENTEEGFKAFLNAYLTSSTDTSSLTYSAYYAIRSAVSVYSFFPILYRDYTHSIVCEAGAGVIYYMDDSEDGYSYIITNYHVIYYLYSYTANGIADTIYIYQYGDTVDYDVSGSKSAGYTVSSDNGIEATFIGGAKNYDLAVLQVKTSDLASYSKAVDIADGYSLAEEVFAVGNPEAEGISVTSGIVSVYSEYIDVALDDYETITVRTLRTDTAINGGNSGGGLFNSAGALVGIVNAKSSSYYTTSGSYVSVENIADALPVDNVVKVVDNIISNYETYSSTESYSAGIYRYTLGLTFTSSNSYAYYDSETETCIIYDDCVVSAVTDSSVASTLGLTAGNIITDITITSGGVSNTINIDRSYMLAEILLTLRVGDSFTITYQTSSTDSTSKTTDSTSISDTSYFSSTFVSVYYC